MAGRLSKIKSIVPDKAAAEQQSAVAEPLFRVLINAKAESCFAHAFRQSSKAGKAGYSYMANSEEKVSKFVQAITAYAEEQRDNIRREIETYKADRMQKAEQDVLTDAYQLIQKETADLRNESVRDMSRRDLAARKEVLEQRKSITDDVFKQVEDKLTAYAATEAYQQKLRGILKEMAAQLPDKDTVYYISNRDEALLKSLSDLCPEGSSVKCAEDIRVGGIRGVNTQKGQIIDNTLDAKLEAQYSWFTKTSGLTIE